MQLDRRVHRSSDRYRAKKTRVIKWVQTLFPLTYKRINIRVSNFKTKDKYFNLHKSLILKVESSMCLILVISMMELQASIISST